jgi:UTP-glucose-1-phosphate uridylyltransferase
MKKTLLILAAGMGSRFGGLKQIEPMGPNGEFIIDYSIYDAKRAGFDKVVFVIKEENYDVFKNTIGRRVEPHMETEYVFQKNDNLPERYREILENRKKPLGTAHAILCAKDKVGEPFAIINADDFYGYDAYKKASDYLEHVPENHYGLVAYRLGNTLTPNGSAKRGVCEVNEKNELVQLTESKVTLDGDMVDVEPLEGGPSFRTNKDTIASMNFLLFTPDLFPTLEERFPTFLDEHQDSLDSCEFLIPIELNDLVDDGQITVDVLETSANWYGVTYKEDKELVTGAIKTLVKQRTYPNKLWKE